MSVAVGFGFYVQMTPAEAIKFCATKIELLSSKQTLLASKSQTIEDHIKELLVGVEQLKHADQL